MKNEMIRIICINCEKKTKMQIRVSVDIEMSSLFDFLVRQKFLSVTCSTCFWFSEWRILYHDRCFGANGTLRSMGIKDNSVLRFEPKNSPAPNFEEVYILY